MSYYSSLKLWIPLLIVLKWYWEVAIEDVLQNICVLQNSQTTKYTAASVFQIYDKYLWRSSTLAKLQPATLMKNWTPLQVFFDCF